MFAGEHIAKLAKFHPRVWKQLGDELEVVPHVQEEAVANNPGGKHHCYHLIICPASSYALMKIHKKLLLKKNFFYKAYSSLEKIAVENSRNQLFLNCRTFH